MSPSNVDPELKAIQAIMSALEPLDEASRTRVIGYAFSRLGITTSGYGDSGGTTPLALEPKREQKTPESKTTVTDVRTLAEQKEPGSANEMAALVGYYLAELAPPGERKTEITTDDIKTYFKQGNYPLPNVPRQTLHNAAGAGYFESLGGGMFRLNPVGHNLVAHSLPRKASGSATKPGRARKPAKKRAATPTSRAKKTKRRSSRS